MNNSNWRWRYGVLAETLAGAGGAVQIHAGQFKRGLGSETPALALVRAGRRSLPAGRSKKA